jgi:hypothetical protein
VLNDRGDFIKIIERFIDNLESNVIYNAIPIIKWLNEDNGNQNSLSICKSFKLSISNK